MVLNSFPDLCVADVATSISFYVALLGLDTRVNHRWYAELGVGERTLIAFVQSGHSTVPVAVGRQPTGLLVSFEVDSASDYAERAESMGCEFVHPLTDELGQRHFMVRDPDGAVVDVIERIAMTPSDVRRLAELRRATRTVASAITR